MSMLPKIDHDIAKKLDKLDLWEKMWYIQYLIPKIQDINRGIELTELEKDLVEESTAAIIKLQQLIELRIMS